MFATAADIAWGHEVLRDPKRIRKIVKAFNDNPEHEDTADTVYFLGELLNGRVNATTDASIAWKCTNEIEKAAKAALPVGERLPSRNVIEKTASANSASTTIAKAQTAPQEKPMFETKRVYQMKHTTTPAETIAELQHVLKLAETNPGIRVFMPNPNTGRDPKEVDLNRVDILLNQLVGLVEDATRDPEYSPTRFTSGDALGRPIADAPKPQPGYGFDEPTPMIRLGYAYLPGNMDPGISPASAFEAPEPTDRHDADEAEIPDFDNDDPLTSIFKSMHGTGKVAPGTFAGTIPDQFGNLLTPAKTHPVEKNAPTIAATDQPMPLSRKRRVEKA